MSDHFEHTDPLDAPFIAFTSDYGFRATFGNESDTRFLRRALQALIQSEIPIKTIEFIKADFLAVTIDSRSGVYDLACVDDADNSFIVEMQVSEFPQFIQRMKFYAFHKFNTMVKKGKFMFTDLTPIYCVGILAKNIYSFKEYYSIGKLKNQEGNLMDDKLVYVTVEMEKFEKTVNEITTDLDKLIFTMKNLKTYADTPPTQFPAFWTEEWLNVAIKELDTRQFSPEQMEQYMMALAKNAQVIEDERIKVLKAEQKGREEATRETKKQAIIKQLQRGKLTEAEIAEDNDMTLEFVKELKSGLK